MLSIPVKKWNESDFLIEFFYRKYPEISVECQVSVWIRRFFQFVEDGRQIRAKRTSIFIRQFNCLARLAVGVGAAENIGIETLTWI